MRERQKTLLKFAVVLWGLACVVGCNTHEVEPFGTTIIAERTDQPRSFTAPKVDVLWVVDDSGSMCEEQQYLRENFDRFVEVLVRNNFDFQLAVVTTHMLNPLSSGRFQTVANPLQFQSCTFDVDVSGCPTAQDAPPTIISSEDPRYHNPDGSVSIDAIRQDFGCRATVGYGGDDSGFEMGLEAARQALSPALLAGHNSGFLRDDALLAVYFLSDENDCSMRTPQALGSGSACEWNPEILVPVDDYVSFFAGLKRDAEGQPQPERVIMAGIIAPDDGLRYRQGQDPQPTCRPPDVFNPDNAAEGAYSGYRYAEVIESFNNHALANICRPPFERALEQMADLIPSALSNCLSNAPPTCQSDSDCSQGAACQARGSVQMCDNIRIQVELERQATQGAMEGRSCQALPDGQRVRCVLVEGQDFVVDYRSAACSSGIEVDLMVQTGPQEQIFIRYPTAL